MVKRARQTSRHRLNLKTPLDARWRIILDWVSDGYERPRGHLPHDIRQTLREIGLHGKFGAYLNSRFFPALPPREKRKTIPTQWKKLILTPGFPDVVKWQAMLFDWAGGFQIAWCDYGKHWYCADDPRRKDCWEHEHMGAKVRFITSHPTAYRKSKERELQRRKEQRGSY